MLSELRHSEARPDEQQGNTLILFPFAVLVLLVLGGIVLDAATVFQADRRAVDEATALANDIAGVVDPAAFHLAPDDGLVLDRVFAATATAAANARLRPELVCSAAVAGDRVAVTCAGTATPIVLPALGGLPSFRVGGTAVATAVEGG